jgi:hypothetical protein
MVACLLSLTALGQSSASSPSTKSATTHKRHKATSSASAATSVPAKSHSTSSSSKKSRKRKSTKVRGQQKIDSERAQAIQEALIRQHYLSGEPSGTWNEASEEAMRRFQADNGWQSKTVPDSRALIKLGLGPSKDHLLNPDSAMTTVPDAPKAETLPTTSISGPVVASPANATAGSSTDPH